MKLLKVCPSPLLHLTFCAPCVCKLCGTCETCIKCSEAFFFKGHGLLGIHTFACCAARVEPPLMGEVALVA